MYGLISKITAIPGQRETLMDVLVAASTGMPGCKSYIVAKDHGSPDAIWVTEIWADKASHEASLSLESVQQAIAAGRPLIAGFDLRVETGPVGGEGI